MNIYYRNLGASKQVTGSCHLVEIKNIEGEKDLKVMVDYGQVQDGTMSFDQLHKWNGRKIAVDFEDLDYVVATHSHFDHISLMGRLQPLGYNGHIITTQLGAEIAEINLNDACKIHLKEIEKQNNVKKNKKSGKHKEPYYPLFNQATTQWAIDNMRGYSYNQEIILSDSVTIKLIPAGHIGGASMVLITIKEDNKDINILFTGDTSCDRDIPFTRKTNISNMKIDYIITESTYGDRIIPNVNPIEEIAKHIKETCVEKQGKILFPVFSIARSTNMLHYLKQTYEKYSEFGNIPIYLCSPMACKAHRVLGKDSSFEYYDDKWDGYKDLWNWHHITYVDNFKKMKEIMERKEKAIYCSSQGMLESGFAQYIASQLLPKKNNKIVMCGYTGVGTLSRNLLEGFQKSITITDIEGNKSSVPIRANIGVIDGLSSHADYKSLITMFKSTKWTKIKKFIVVHGNEETCYAFADKLKNNFNAEVYVPNYGDTIKIY